MFLELVSTSKPPSQTKSALGKLAVFWKILFFFGFAWIWRKMWFFLVKNWAKKCRKKNVIRFHHNMITSTFFIFFSRRYWVISKWSFSCRKSKMLFFEHLFSAHVEDFCGKNVRKWFFCDMVYWARTVKRQYWKKNVKNSVFFLSFFTFFCDLRTKIAFFMKMLF